MKIILIGAGNLGNQFYQKMINNPNIELIQWVNRSSKLDKSAEGISIIKNLSDLKSADIYILAVSDDAISFASDQISKESFLVHTAGSVSINALSNQKRKGVLYPIQTFSENREIDFSKFFFGIEASQKKDLSILIKLTDLLNTKYILMDSNQREALHLAAVLVNNFTNYLFTEAKKICASHQLSFDLLLPLIKETIDKFEVLLPKDAQTGPAIRNDQHTIEKHLDLIRDPVLKKIYLTLTSAIQNHYGNKKL